MPFDAAVKRYDVLRRHVAKWCSIDTTLGFLSVHLEEREALAAWVVSTDGPDSKPMNLGATVIQALLGRYQVARSLAKAMAAGGAGGAAHAAATDDASSSEGRLKSMRDQLLRSGLTHNHFALPDHTPVMLSQTSEPASTLRQFTVGTADDPSLRLEKFVPEWIHRCLSDAEYLQVRSILFYVLASHICAILYFASIFIWRTSLCSSIIIQICNNNNNNNTHTHTYTHTHTHVCLLRVVCAVKQPRIRLMLPHSHVRATCDA